MQKTFEKWNLLYADRLDKIRDIFLTVTNNQGILKKDLYTKIRETIYHPRAYIEKNKNTYFQKRTIEEFQKFKEKIGEYYRWRKRTLVEYIRAAEFLGLIEERKVGKNLRYYIPKISFRQKSIIVKENNFNNKFLTPNEKKGFIHILMENKRFREFLAWFMPDGKHPYSYKDFIKRSKSISFVFDPKISRPKDMKGPNVYISNDKRHEIEKDKLRITWTYREWSKFVGLTDEIKLNPKGKKWKDDNWRCFPIKKHKDDFNPFKFAQLVQKEFKIKPNEKIRLSIPLLLFRVCSKYYISVSDVKDLVILCNKKFGGRFYLEQLSSVFFDEKYKSSYIKLGGYYRGGLVINLNILEVKND